ncbi:MAG: hypothetical protein U1F35_10030 [Steroidobacteraceae bacterium]
MGYPLIDKTDVAPLPVAHRLLDAGQHQPDAVFDTLAWRSAVDRPHLPGTCASYLLWVSAPLDHGFILTFAVLDWSPRPRSRTSYAHLALLGLLVPPPPFIGSRRGKDPAIKAWYR